MRIYGRGLRRYTSGALIKKYMLLMLLFFSASGMQSQIIYTDISDTILTFPEGTPGVLDDLTNYFYFDLDNDGSNDFYFYAHYWEEWYSPSASEHPHYVMQLNSLASAGIPWSNGCAVDFAYADTIWNDEWDSWGLLYINIVGYWENCNLPFLDRYIGLRLTQGAYHYYGWIRLDASKDTLRFKDFAVNTVPNQEIFAGQTSTAGIVALPVEEDIEIFCDGTKIQFKSGAFRSYAIYDTRGVLLENGSVDEGDRIHLHDYRSGLYILEVTLESRKIRQKILVQR